MNKISFAVTLVVIVLFSLNVSVFADQATLNKVDIGYALA